MPRRKILIKSGYHLRKDCPISLFLKEKVNGARLIDEEDKEIACQTEKTEKGSFLFWILEHLSAREEKVYTLITNEKDILSKEAGVELIQAKEKVEIKVSSQPFSSYYYNDVVRPYLWPIIDNSKRNLTRTPATLENKEGFDHIHHRSCWIAHGDINGIDNWSEEKGHGYQIHQAFKEIISGPIFGKIRAKNYWTDEEKKKVLEEERIIKVYNLVTSRIIDFEINFQATERNIKFGDTKEGGILSIRINPLINADKSGLIENAYGGVNEKETWGKRAHWCDYSGEVKGEKVGLAIFDHPSNFRYPTYWHVRNYGLMTANPFALSHYYNDPERDGSYVLFSGDNLVFRYRLFVHSGNARKGRVTESYHNYINPPEVLIV